MEQGHEGNAQCGRAIRCARLSSRRALEWVGRGLLSNLVRKNHLDICGSLSWYQLTDLFYFSIRSLLGSATAAQLAHYCALQVEDFEDKIAKGDFSPIKAWLTDKVHRHGRRYPSLDALLTDQLGEPLNPKYFIDYLTKKYTELYKC